MVKTLTELGQALNTLYPTRYLKFNRKADNQFIVYTDEGQEDFFADNQTLTEITTVDIDFYSTTKDITAERRIKDLLRTNKLTYDVSNTTYLNNEDLYLITFTVELIDKYKTLEELNNG